MSKIGKNWICPYCNHAQVIADARYDADWQRVFVQGWKQGDVGYYKEFIVCANANCRELSFELRVVRRGHDSGNKFEIIGTPVAKWRLLPLSYAKPQPDYIPEALRLDYQEACAIRDLSPKASATLTRRCIQGIIRDFCGIVKKRLVDEIDELKKLVDSSQAPAGVLSDTVTAIDNVRKIGNIGAHMEADINVIIDVDPNEAQILIELVEALFVEWYVARYKRTQRLEKIGQIATEKKAQQKNNNA